MKNNKILSFWLGLYGTAVLLSLILTAAGVVPGYMLQILYEVLPFVAVLALVSACKSK